MRLICTDEANCNWSCADYEAAGPYAAPTCPKCESPMEPLGERLDPRRHELDRAEEQRLQAEDAWFAERKQADAEPAYEPGFLMRRQAGGVR